MRLDSKKQDLAKLTSVLKRLASLSSKAEPEARNWASDTIKTLEAGKLEDFDLVEFVSASYESELAGHGDKRPVWDRSRSLLDLIEQMAALGLRDAKLEKIRLTLAGWKQDAGL